MLAIKVEYGLHRKGNGGDMKVTTPTLFQSDREQEELAIEEAIAGGMPVFLVKYGSTIMKKIFPAQEEYKLIVKYFQILVIHL